jgi:GntR family transcriptional repressor for pyruvate dehydrogenase complex
MTELKPVFRVTLSQQVATQIAGMISAGRWKPGEKLPSEAALCQTFHVGRSTLREALKSLAFIGLVRMKAGEGTYVADGSTKFLENAFAQGLLTTEKDIEDLCETRLLLETELVALCAQRASDSDLQKIAALVEAMQESLSQGEEAFLPLDVQFHIAIADASQNQVLAQLLRTIRELLREVVMKSQKVPGARELAYAQHREILEALKQRNPRKARVAMREHLQTFQRGLMVMANTPVSSDLQANQR